MGATIYVEVRIFNNTVQKPDKMWEKFSRLLTFQLRSNSRNSSSTSLANGSSVLASLAVRKTCSVYLEKTFILYVETPSSHLVLITTQ